MSLDVQFLWAGTAHQNQRVCESSMRLKGVGVIWSFNEECKRNHFCLKMWSLSPECQRRFTCAAHLWSAQLLFLSHVVDRGGRQPTQHLGRLATSRQRRRQETSVAEFFGLLSPLILGFSEHRTAAVVRTTVSLFVHILVPGSRSLDPPSTWHHAGCERQQAVIGWWIWCHNETELSGSCCQGPQVVHMKPQKYVFGSHPVERLLLQQEHIISLCLLHYGSLLIRLWWSLGYI